MKDNMYKAIAVAFVSENYGNFSDIEKTFEIWWDKTGKGYFEQRLYSNNTTILQEANSIIFDRDEEKDRKYGPFSESMSKAAVVATELCNKEITTEDFYKCMISLKISRMAYNHKHDTMLDALGYIAGLDDYLKNKK